MKPLIILIAIATISLLFLNMGHAQEALSGILTVNFADETAEYTESHDFSAEYGTVKTTATVFENDCNLCLRDNNPSSCLLACDQVIMRY